MSLLAAVTCQFRQEEVLFQETDNPDLRDRAYVYWRLLSTDPEAAKEVVLAEKPIIDDTSSHMEPALLDQLLAHLSSLSSVYHKPPEVSPVEKLQITAFTSPEKWRSLQSGQQCIAAAFLQPCGL